jgi:hypothetical protein
MEGTTIKWLHVLYFRVWEKILMWDGLYQMTFKDPSQFLDSASLWAASLLCAPTSEHFSQCTISPSPASSSWWILTHLSRNYPISLILLLPNLFPPSSFSCLCYPCPKVLLHIMSFSLRVKMRPETFSCAQFWHSIQLLLWELNWLPSSTCFDFFQSS